MSPSTKRTMVIAVLLIALASMVFGVIAYQVVAQGKRLTEQMATVAAQRAQEVAYNRLVGQAEDTADEREQLRGFFLQRDDDSVDLLNEVETIAPLAGVELETNQLDVIKDKSSNSEWIQVTFSFTGSRVNVQNFIQVLETLPYVLRLTGLDMSALPNGSWQARVTLQVRVLAYDA